ncbi:hypothetical protein PVL29_008002 [Vitis rotundifolia]|uniref:F-box domain-containing protein n=1 Tax=Vitis rotundifolia TaxID=103349 RepID=A0AA39DZ44_VITRO|nr:hypothetical protein PVL29_008002 [Vitis rotundifolia]
MKLDHNEDDHFDGLSDELLSLIFSKVLDAKSLCRCSAVSKRFASLIPLVDAVLLTVPPPKSKPNRGLFLNFGNSLVTNFIDKLLQFLHQIVLPQSSVSFHSNEGSIHQFSSQVLKNFSHITSLHIQFPSHGGELGANGTGSLLKWEAEFGRELESCVVLGATYFQRSNKISRIPKRQDRVHESSLATDELKLRVAWMISCLFAASARHCLLKQIIADNPLMLRSLVIEDGSKQGRLRMGEDQFKELRKSPAICIKLWYVPLLELPASGCVMKGATLIVIRPLNQMMKMKSDGDLLVGAFDGEEEAEAFCEAVKEIVKEKKPYLMEMNSF